MAITRISHYIGAVWRGLRSGDLVDKTRRFWTYGKLERSVGKRFQYIVQSGPFKGMRYIEIPGYRAFIPKLMGTYEHELHPAIDYALTHGYKRMLNIGSAEGYYAVGFAWKVPTLEVFAYDIEGRERALCHDLCAINNVQERVQVLGECTHADFERLTDGNTLIMIDCEGCERDLLDPAKAPRLLQVDILVEVHHFVFPDIPELLKTRFGQSHDIEVIAYTGRQPGTDPALAFLGAEDQKRAIYERRESEQHWYYMKARPPRDGV